MYQTGQNYVQVDKAGNPIDGTETGTVHFDYAEINLTQENDPSLKFHFMNESSGYKYMLAMQKKDGREVVGILSKNASGKTGILVLPWFSNDYNRSNPKKGYYGKFYEDHRGNRYSPLAIIHTHPENDLHPSDADKNSGDSFKLPMYILGDKNYRPIQTIVEPQVV